MKLQATPRRQTLLMTILCAGFVAVALWPGAAAAQIRIATAGPVTGQLAAMGEQMLKGARLAVADLNAAGGLLGQEIELLVADDQCDPKQAVAEANRLIGKGVVFVAGHFCSSASIAASLVYQEEGVIMISPASTSPKLTEEGGNMIFRVCGRDDRQGTVAGRFLARHFRGKRIAILHDKSAYGKGLAEEARRALRAEGEREILFDSYTAGERDYRGLVTKLKRAEADVLFIGGYHPEAGLILRQMREQGMQTQLVGGDALIVQEFWQIAGPMAEGVMMTFVSDPRNSPAAQSAIKRFRAMGIEPEGYILYTYAAIQAWAQAVHSAGTSDPAKVSAALHAGEFKTVIGRFRFDAKGDVDLPSFSVYRWSGGRYAPLGGED